MLFGLEIFGHQMGKPLNEYGEIVAIVEAKRASIDPRSAILTLLHAVMPNTTITGVLKPFAGGYIIPSNPWASIRLSANFSSAFFICIPPN